MIPYYAKVWYSHYIMWILTTPWTAACQIPLSMGFPRQEYWSGLPFPTPGDLASPEIEPTSPVLQVDSLPLSHQGSLREKGYVMVNSLLLTLKTYLIAQIRALPYFSSRTKRVAVPVQPEKFLIMRSACFRNPKYHFDTFIITFKKLRTTAHCCYKQHVVYFQK